MLETADLLSILQLCIRYTNAIDQDRTNEMAACFTEDGICEFASFSRNNGRAEIAAGSSDFIQKLGHDKRHILTNHEMKPGLDRDHARGMSYLVVLDRRSGPVIAATGVWTDEYRRTDEGWLISHRRLDLDPAFEANAYGATYEAANRTSAPGNG